MGHTSESREVLIAELLGDFVKVLDRIDAVMPALDEVCERLELVAARLPGSAKTFLESIGAMAVERQNTAAAYITRHANEFAKKTLDEQTGAMKESARAVFASEVAPTLRRLAQELGQAAQWRRRRWDDWLVNVSLVVGSAAITTLLTTAWPGSTNSVNTRAAPSVQSPAGVEQAPASVASSQAAPPPRPERAHARK